jgi:hypothetical protein
MAEELRGPFEKFVDSPYYSESELCGGVVTVFFFFFRSTSLVKRCTSYNAPPTSRKRKNDEVGGSCNDMREINVPLGLTEYPVLY